MGADHHAVHAFFYASGTAGLVKPHIMCVVRRDFFEAFFNKVDSGFFFIGFKPSDEIKKIPPGERLLVKAGGVQGVLYGYIAVYAQDEVIYGNVQHVHYKICANESLQIRWSTAIVAVQNHKHIRVNPRKSFVTEMSKPAIDDSFLASFGQC